MTKSSLRLAHVLFLIAAMLLIVAYISFALSVYAMQTTNMTSVRFPVVKNDIWKAFLPTISKSKNTQKQAIVIHQQAPIAVKSTEKNPLLDPFNSIKHSESDGIVFQRDFPNLLIENNAPKEYLELTRKVFSVLPRDHVESLRTLVIKYDDTSHRGLGGKSTIILNAKKKGRAMSHQEFVGVLIHEIGHVVDIGYMVSQDSSYPSTFTDNNTPVYTDDKSLEFYQLSWQDELQKKSKIYTYDFASEYAMSDAFEDFAEMYNLYVTHGREARRYASVSDVFREKYNWIKYNLFAGFEFKTGNIDNIQRASDRVWDSTLLPYSLEELWSQM